jgi:hypothetical protein
MSDCDLPLFLNVREEGTVVLDMEIEDTMLIGGLEGGAEDGRVCGLREGSEVDAVEGRQHAEFELNGVAGGGDEGGQVGVGVFGDLDCECLKHTVSNDR